MFVEQLFKKHEVTCPEWLSMELLDDEWNQSEYSIEGDTHKWTLVNPLQNLMITFDGNEYHFKAFTEDGKLLFDNVITKYVGIAC